MLGILGAGVVVAAVGLWENVDIRQLTPTLVRPSDAIPDTEPSGAAAYGPEGFSAVMLSTTRNRRFFPDAGFYDGELARWGAAIADVGGQVREVRDERGLAGLRPDEVLVLPEAPCLSGAERALIRAHLARGGGVVSNWAVGARDAECSWRGWQTLIDLTGAEAVEELRTRPRLHVTVPAGIPLSPGLDPGTRIELRPEPALALRMDGPRVYWSDWALNPQPDRGGTGADVAAVATRTAGGGRAAWFGIRAGQALAARDSLHLRRLVQNGVLWAAGVPTASVVAWPGAARAAMVFSLDVEDQPGNAVAVASLFASEGLPGTFFAVTRIVRDDEALAEQLVRAGEIGSQTVDHTPLAGLTPRDQEVRLRRSRDEIERWAGTVPAGLRPPEDSFDSATVRGWSAAGGEYILARNESRTASPEIHLAPGGVIVVLPRLLKDDYNIVVQDHALRSERIGEAFVLGAEKIRAIGGLAVVAGHTQIMQSDARRRAYRVVADRARSEGDWWIASGVDVARWWRARAATRLAFDTTSVGSRTLFVHAPPDEPLRGAWVEIVLPDSVSTLVPLVGGAPVDFQTTDWGIRVPVGDLGPGEERRISLVSEEDPGLGLRFDGAGRS